MKRKMKTLLTTIAVIIGITLFVTTSYAAEHPGSIKKGIQQRVEALENLFETLKDTIMNQSDEISALQATVADQEERINELVEQVSKLSSNSDGDEQDSEDNGREPEFFVVGKITKEDGTPVQGAEIRLIDSGGYGTANSKYQGDYKIGGYELGTEQVIIAERDYLVAKQTIPQTSADSNYEVNLVLVEAGTISGNVTYADGAKKDMYFVELYDQTGNLVNKNGIAEDGKYHLNAEPGTYTILLNANGHTTEPQTVKVVAGQTVTQDLTITN